MPNYEYECGSCGGRFEMIRKFSDPDLTVCTLCKAANIRKVLSPTAFVLKGGGWYATDYPTADRKKSGETDKAPVEPKPSAPAGCASGSCGGNCPAKGPA